MTLEDALGVEVLVVMGACVKTCCGGRVQKYETEMEVRGKVTAVHDTHFTMQTRELGRLGTVLAERKDLVDVRPIVD